MSEWRFAGASVVGTSHAKLQSPCQDAHCCEVVAAPDGAAVLVAIASDGAGSAARAEIGAALACSVFAEKVRACIDAGSGISHMTRDLVLEWLEGFRQAVEELAVMDGGTARDYACTLLCAVVGDTDAVFVQIGDGVIVVSQHGEPDDFSWVFWPQNGEYANTTFFATDSGASARLLYTQVRARVDELAVMTDGMERLALHFESQTAHAPFFRPMFQPLRRDGPERDAALQAALASFLGSGQVNERTDDDKTLVLASRHRIDEKSSAAPESESQPGRSVEIDRKRPSHHWGLRRAGTRHRLGSQARTRRRGRRVRPPRKHRVCRQALQPSSLT